MRTGKLAVEFFSIYCPECNEIVDAKCDGTLLNQDDYYQLGTTIVCKSCKVVFRRPLILFDNRTRKDTTL